MLPMLRIFNISPLPCILVAWSFAGTVATVTVAVNLAMTAAIAVSKYCGKLRLSVHGGGGVLASSV